MPRAVEYDDKNGEENVSARWKTAAFLLLGFAIIVALLLTATFLSLNKTKNEDSDNVPFHDSSTAVPMAPTVMPMPDKLRSLLPEFTVNAFRHERSPQYAAYEWMLGDPSLEHYSDDRLIQRFALASLFFSTGKFQVLV